MTKERSKLQKDSGGNPLRVKNKDINAMSELSPTFLSVINSMADHVFCKDLNGVFIACSEVFAHFHGHEVADVVGRTEWDLFDEERARFFVEDDQQIISSQAARKNVDWNHYPHGNFLMETLKSPLQDGEGNIIGVIGVSRDITERYEEELSVNAKMAEIENFFRVSNDLMIVADFEGNILRVNTAWSRALGYTSSDLLGKSLFDVIHPDDQENSRETITKLIETKAEVEFINRLSSCDGILKNFEWRGQLNNDRLYLAARDITKRILDQELQREQRQLLEYRNKFEQTLTTISTRLINLPAEQIDSEIIQVLGQIGELIEVDRSYVFFINKSEETMTNTHEWVSPGISPEIKNLADLPLTIFPWWMEKLEKFEVINVPSVKQLPDEAKEERIILDAQNIQSILGIPLISDKELIGFVGFDAVMKARTWTSDSIVLLKMVSDIISNALMRRKHQKELSQSEERKSALLKAVPDIILRLTQDGKIIDYKPAQDDENNRDFKQYVGKPTEYFLPPDTTANILLEISDAIETKELQTLEFPFMAEDSRRVMEARIQYSGENEVTAIIRDVSERARLEQIKSDFINKATHELRTPIATMLLMANLMDGASSETEKKEFWDILKSELDREKILIDDILTAGKMDNQQLPLHYKMVDVKKLFKNILIKTEIQAKDKELRFVSSFSREDGVDSDFIQSDESVLNQIFGNLIGNALKFTPAGGEVKVNVRLTTLGLTVTVEDSGIGIPAEDVPFLFSRFFRGTNAIQHEIQGTGIGLFIVKSLLERISGKIKMRTKMGKGTKFIVTLPRTQ